MILPQQVMALFTSTRALSDSATAVTLDDDRGWHWIALQCSTVAGGQWWPRSERISWVSGRRVHYIMDESKVNEIQEARAITRDLTGDDPGWGVGACARAILRLLPEGCDLPCYRSRELITELPHGYIQCYPQHLRHAALYDVQSCYYNILATLPGPRMSYANHRPVYTSNSDRELEVWTRIMERIGQSKHLRNALVGCMTGGSAWSQMFSRGQIHRVKTRPGPCVTAGRVVVRLACELCMIACQQTNAAYSVVDCVISPDATPPTIWGDCGLSTRRRAEGPAEVLSPTNYRVGRHQTKNFDKPSLRYVQCVETPAAPALWHYRDWMQRRAA